MGNLQLDNHGGIYDANKPNNQTISLSSLFSSSNTNDIASVRVRIPGGGRTNIIFAASATNTPVFSIITLFTNDSRNISHLFMDDDGDDLGIRVSGSSLSYSSSAFRLEQDRV